MGTSSNMTKKRWVKATAWSKKVCSTKTRGGELELYFQSLVEPELQLEPSKFLAAPAPIQL